MTVLVSTIYRDLHALLARAELDGRPSLLTTLCVVSALQFLNLPSVGMFFESAFSKPMPASRIGFLMLVAALLAINAGYAKRIGLSEGEHSPRRVGLRSAGGVYLILTLVAFIGAIAYMSSVHES